MKAVILAGGRGTRISEESDLRPKPMIEIGGKPILWHIMKIFSAYNINDFVICCGYKGYIIKEYFVNYWLHMSNVTVDTKNNSIQAHSNDSESWRVTLVDTGEETMTGGRLARARQFIDSDVFCLTYGDGVSDVNIRDLVSFHRESKATATLTAVQPPGRFGSFEHVGGKIIKFQEKPSGDGGWINGGFFVCSPDVLDYVQGDTTVWEREPLEQLAETRQLAAYFHKGFWQPMDTLRDKNHLEQLWASGRAPWKVW